jgi:hypothetical protein
VQIVDYKKIIKDQELRIKILNLLGFIPDAWMLKLQYRIKIGRNLSLDNPKRYTEKLQWYKLYYRDPLMTQCADKYAVRDYIKSKGLSHINKKLYGVFDNADEINFDDLPKAFVMKTTNGSGTNLFCKDKSTFPIEKAKKTLTTWLARDVFSSGREWAYKNIEPKIVVEELLEDENNPFDGINDYKFLCFNGEPRYVVLDVDRHIAHKRNIYDMKWNFIDVTTDCPNLGDCIPKPKGFNEMAEV